MMIRMAIFLNLFMFSYQAMARHSSSTQMIQLYYDLRSHAVSDSERNLALSKSIRILRDFLGGRHTEDENELVVVEVMEELLGHKPLQIAQVEMLARTALAYPVVKDFFVGRLSPRIGSEILTRNISDVSLQIRRQCPGVF